MTTWNDKPNDYEHACKEIERLRTDLWHQSAHHGAILEAAARTWKYRDDIIEECARVAENWHIQKALWPRDAADIAAAIRALKNKG